MKKNERVKVTIEIAGDKRKGTCWAKAVTGINLEEKGGFMFSGDFLTDGEIMLEIGTVILQVETRGSWKHHKKLAYIGLVNENGEIDWQESEGLDWNKKGVSVAEICEKLINTKNNEK
jgi:hypothetical protein